MKILKESLKFANSFVSSDADEVNVWFPMKLALNKRRELEKILSHKTEVYFTGPIHVIDGIASNIGLNTEGAHYSIGNADFDIYCNGNAYASISFDSHSHYLYFSILDKKYDISVTFSSFCPEEDYKTLFS